MHSVTQSSFANPCTYLTANTSSNSPAGFDSGLQSAATFAINVTDTNREHFPSYSPFPILKDLSLASHLVFLQAGESDITFFTKSFLRYRYFTQISHCGIGMVGSINANNETNTFAQYLAAAKAIGSSETTVCFMSSLEWRRQLNFCT